MPQTIDNLSATWSNSLTTYTAFKFNITDTASNAASLLMDLQVGGASRFKVGKGGALSFNNERTGLEPYGNGLIMAANGSFPFFYDASSFRASLTASIGWTSQSTGYGTVSDTILTRRAAANLRLGAADAAAPVAQTLSVQSVVAGTSNTAGVNLTITGSQGTGTGAGGSIIFQVAPAGSSGTAQNALADALTIDSTRSVYIERYFRTRLNIFAILDDGNNSIQMGQNVTLGWTAGGAYGPSPDVILRRDAANTLALRNGANAQAFRVYGTTDGTNSEFLSMSFNSGNNTFVITTDKAGSGATRDLYLYSNSALWFGTGGSGKWTINTSGHLLTSNDNLFDIGASGASRPRDIYAATAVRAPIWVFATAGGVQGTFRSEADGVLRLTNSGINDFGRLQFGGTTSSFPAIKRSSTTLQARLADDSGFASVQGKLTTDTAYTAGDPTTTGYLVVYDSAGVAYKIPAVAV